MKSIIEEASSIQKAIEKGWQKAGQPKEFSVKIFEEPQRNFIGMTVKSAKIGIFFNDTPPIPAKTAATQKSRPAHVPNRAVKEKPIQTKREQPATQPQRPQVRQARDTHGQAREKIKLPQEQQTPATSHEPMSSERAPHQTPVWTETMMQDIQIWLREALAFVTVRPINFTLENQHFYLKINFSEPIFEDKNREKQLFSSLSVLLLQLLKNKNRRPLKGYKIILLS